MQHDFYLAWRYLCHHRVRTIILVACLSLLATLPLALHVMLDAGETQMTARAESTPLLVGSKGSALDLTLNALYFNAANQSHITMAESDRVGQTGWADPLPIYVRFRVRGHPLVGVTLDYFDFRRLTIAQGNSLAMLGECVLGADAAEAMGLKPGDSLPTTPENLFDLSGVYPIKLHVAGLLAKSHTPDDQAVFIDLQTAWVIEGLGHGHAEGKKPSQSYGLPFGQVENHLIHDAKLLTYTEITPENLDSFHFHGDPSGYPISAVIALPHDRKSSTLLKGRYIGNEEAVQLVQPLETIRGLLENIFRVGILFDAVLALVGAAMLLALGLVFALSMRLRQRELQTIFLLGCSKTKVLRLVSAEILLLGLASMLVCLALLEFIQLYAGGLVRLFITP
jgi:putative ABC transport system permease protein